MQKSRRVEIPRAKNPATIYLRFSFKTWFGNVDVFPFELQMFDSMKTWIRTEEKKGQLKCVLRSVFLVDLQVREIFFLTIESH